jgi:hypothetical protein
VIIAWGPRSKVLVSEKDLISFMADRMLKNENETNKRNKRAAILLSIERATEI